MMNDGDSMPFGVVRRRFEQRIAERLEALVIADLDDVLKVQAEIKAMRLMIAEATSIATGREHANKPIEPDHAGYA